MARTEISAAEALKAFKTLPTVQTAKPGKIRFKDDAGNERERDGFIVKDVSATADHVTGAAKYSDGRVVITTIDGKRHEARA
jgi:hypothetical protein